MFERILFLTFFMALSLPGQTSDLYSFQLESITGEKISLRSFKGRPLLIVNIATQCG